MKRTTKKTSVPQSVAAAEAKDIQASMTANQISPAKPEDPKPETKKDGKPEEKKPRKQRVEQILVKHEFSVPELAELGKSLADKSRVLADLQGEAKACARQYKDKIEGMQTEINSTVAKVKEGFEMVPVDAIVMVQIDKTHRTATKAFYRKDTGAFIKSEDVVSNTELPLFNVLPESRDLSKPLEKKFIDQAV